MTQQINLFNDKLRPRRNWLSVSSISIVVVVSLLVLSSLRATSLAQIEKLSATAKQSGDLVLNEQNKLAELTRQAVAVRPNTKLSQEISELQEVINRRNEIISTLEGKTLGYSEGYSRFFNALARQTSNGIWLTAIGIEGNGDHIDLQGRALDPASLPPYLQKLNGEVAFAGKNFTALSLNKPELPAERQAQPATNAANSNTKPRLAPYVQFRLSSSDAPLKTGESNKE